MKIKIFTMLSLISLLRFAYADDNFYQNNDTEYLEAVPIGYDINSQDNMWRFLISEDNNHIILENTKLLYFGASITLIANRGDDKFHVATEIVDGNKEGGYVEIGRCKFPITKDGNDKTEKNTSFIPESQVDFIHCFTSEKSAIFHIKNGKEIALPLSGTSSIINRAYKFNQTQSFGLVEPFSEKKEEKQQTNIITDSLEIYFPKEITSQEKDTVSQWFTITNLNECIPSYLSPGEIIRSDQENGIMDQTTTLQQDSNGKVEVVRLYEPKGNDINIVSTYYRTKDLCLDEVRTRQKKFDSLN